MAVCSNCGQRLLTGRQAAEFIGMSEAFLERDRWAGAQIPFVKIGKKAVRYRCEDLANYIKRRIRKSTSDPGERK